MRDVDYVLHVQMLYSQKDDLNSFFGEIVEGENVIFSFVNKKALKKYLKDQLNGK